MVGAADMAGAADAKTRTNKGYDFIAFVAHSSGR
jgi:hypothetical protein